MTTLHTGFTPAANASAALGNRIGLGAIIIILAVMLELAAHPPFWVHALIWVPLTCLLVVVSLRVSKGALIIAEHRNRAVAGQIEDKADTK